MATIKLYLSPERLSVSTRDSPGLSLFNVRALPRLVLSLERRQSSCQKMRSGDSQVVEQVSLEKSVGSSL
jgi:hypothetical protein